jgi:hypothetical protein
VPDSTTGQTLLMADQKQRFTNRILSGTAAALWGALDHRRSEIHPFAALMIVPSSALDSMGLGSINGLAALGKAGQL